MRARQRQLVWSGGVDTFGNDTSKLMEVEYKWAMFKSNDIT